MLRINSPNPITFDWPSQYYMLNHCRLYIFGDILMKCVHWKSRNSTVRMSYRILCSMDKTGTVI